MKKYVLLFMLCFSLPVCAVNQEYMPDGYVRDDVIHPYYVQYVSEYFRKIDSGEQKFSWPTYRQQVERPVGKIMDKFYMDSMQGLHPKKYDY